MNERNLLMIPGPTNVDPTVLRSLAQPTASHVSREFAVIFKETLSDLGEIFKTRGLVLPLAGSGTLGDEVALANVIEHGDRVLSVSGGYFGDRLGEVAEALGANVDKFQVSLGSAADPTEVEKRLRSAKYKALLAVHVDTATGAANPVKELTAAAKSNNVLFVLDAVGSLGGINVDMDGWGIDVCFTASQKALAVPPGLAIVAFNQRALEARSQRKTPMGTYYGDLKRWEPIMQDPTRYFATPPVNMIYALNTGCKMIKSEGLEARFTRHAKLGSAFRAAMRSLRLRLLCEDEWAASTMTVTYYPTGVDDALFRKTMAEQFGIVIAGGLGPLKGKVFRVGHMGNVNRTDINSTISAIEGALAAQHHVFNAGSGIATANRILTQ